MPTYAHAMIPAISYIAIEAMAIEIVDLPIEHGDLPWLIMLVDQRVRRGELMEHVIAIGV